MGTFDVSRVRLCGGKVLVRFLAPAKQTAGGVLLPDVCRENWQEVVVLSRGPGEFFADTGRRAEPHVEPGDVCLIRFADFQALPGSQDTGSVDAEDILGVVDPETGVLNPLGEWVRLGLPERPQEVSGIALPQYSQRRPDCGTVEAWGPGRLIRKGRLAGLRIGMLQSYSLPEDFSLLGRTAYYDSSAEAFEIGRDWISHVLVKASDLIAVPEIEPCPR